jgi:predicted Zn-dependent protease
MVSAIVARVPPQWEQQYGDGLMTELHSEMTFVDDTNRVAQLAALAAPLLRVLPPAQREYQFHIVEDDEPNAFALPGGHIVVTTGMLQRATPAELLGAVAHEVAHVTLKHGFRKVISEAGPFLICQIFLRGRNGAAGVLAGGSALLIGQSFSQEYEMEADDTGWQYLVKANLDPRGLTDLLRSLKSYEAEHKPLDALPQAFQSHPALDKRIARLEAKWKKLPRKTGFIELKESEPIRPEPRRQPF